MSILMNDGPMFTLGERPQNLHNYLTTYQSPHLLRETKPSPNVTVTPGATRTPTTEEITNKQTVSSCPGYPCHKHVSTDSSAENGQSVHVKPIRRLMGIVGSSWWWWEIGGCVVSLIGLGLIILILKRVDEQPIDLWQYPIRPNSLIAAASTITKGAMMVPVASCLSQLKWDHFHHRPNPLHHLQIYDDASRGPWGCLYMIFTGRLRVLSAWAFALVTLAALGFEPSVQQMMVPETRRTLLTNVTARVGKAERFASKGFNDYWSEIEDHHLPTADLFQLQTKILSGAAGSVQDPNFDCPEPAVKCTWGQFDTLAVCASYRNMTDIAQRDCRTNKYDTYDNITCTFTFPDGKPVSLITIQRASNPVLPVLATSQACYSKADSIPTSYLNGVRLDASNSDKYDVFTVFFHWCTRTYHGITATPAGIQEANYTLNHLVYYDWANTVPLSPIVEDSDFYYTFYSPVLGRPFNISSTGQLLLEYVNSLFNQGLTRDFHNEGITPNLSPAQFLYTTDLAKFADNLAETLTTQVRSALPGDNRDAITWPGQAFYQETYWRIYWAWVTLPVIEVVTTIILLGVCITFSTNQPLLKSSPLALLFHRLEGHEEDILLYGTRRGTIGELQDHAKNLRVELSEDKDGTLKFLPAQD